VKVRLSNVYIDTELVSEDELDELVRHELCKALDELQRIRAARKHGCGIPLWDLDEEKDIEYIDIMIQSYNNVIRDFTKPDENANEVYPSL